MFRSKSGHWIHVNTDIFSLFQFSLLSMISLHFLLFFHDKLPCFCNESLTGGLYYLIPFCCENNYVLFTAAMGQISPRFEKYNDRAGWCITASSCVSGDRDNILILLEDTVLILRDNTEMLPSASLPHAGNLICPAATQETAPGSYTTFKAACF